MTIVKFPHPSEWMDLIDRVLFVRKYCEIGTDDPKPAVEATLRLQCAPDVAADLNAVIIREVALRLMADPQVTDAVNMHLHESVYRAREMGLNWIISAVKDVYERTMQYTPVKNEDGVPVFAKFNPAAALKAIELAGRHVDVGAFRDHVELETGPNLTAVLEAARKRLESGETIDVTPETSLPHPEQNRLTMDELLGVTP